MYNINEILGIFGVLLLAILLMDMGHLLGTTEYERILVREGYAEYYLDEDNNKQWRIKPNTCKE